MIIPNRRAAFHLIGLVIPRHPKAKVVMLSESGKEGRSKIPTAVGKDLNVRFILRWVIPAT